MFSWKRNKKGNGLSYQEPTVVKITEYPKRPEHCKTPDDIRHNIGKTVYVEYGNRVRSALIIGVMDGEWGGCGFGTLPDAGYEIRYKNGETDTIRQGTEYWSFDDLVSNNKNSTKRTVEVYTRLLGEWDNVTPDIVDTDRYLPH
jgi:hypothetical protein